MTALFMRSAHDLPHVQHPDKPAQTRCGLPLVGMREVTPAQVVVFLDDRRCTQCDPSHHFRALQEKR